MMINDVINEIIRTEKEADDVIKNATEAALDISLKTSKEIEKQKQLFSDTLKEKTSEIMKKAEKEAQKASAKIFEEAKAESDNIMKAAEKNFNSSVQIVTNYITKGRI